MEVILETIAGANEVHNGAIDISWSDPQLGFGHITIIKDKNNKVGIWSEYMGLDFVREVLAQILDEAMLME